MSMPIGSSKGAWVIHVVIIILVKMIFNFISVLNNDWKWTLTNLTYNIGSYIMFHQVKELHLNLIVELMII